MFPTSKLQVETSKSNRSRAFQNINFSLPINNPRPLCGSTEYIHHEIIKMRDRALCTLDLSRIDKSSTLNRIAVIYHEKSLAMMR
jgi:hypothetical protein